jgi:hypothetical protein
MYSINVVKKLQPKIQKIKEVPKMPLRAKVANKSVTDSKGFVTGVIQSILDIEDREEKQGRKIVRYAAQFEFHVKSEGSNKPIIYKFWVGQNLNSQMFKNDENDSEDYNRLTRLCLNLGLLKESDLKSMSDDKLPDLELLEGSKIRFKLIPSKKNSSLQTIDIASIELVK